MTGMTFIALWRDPLVLGIGSFGPWPRTFGVAVPTVFFFSAAPAAAAAEAAAAAALTCLSSSSSSGITIGGRSAAVVPPAPVALPPCPRSSAASNAWSWTAPGRTPSGTGPLGSEAKLTPCVIIMKYVLGDYLCVLIDKSCIQICYPSFICFKIFIWVAFLMTKMNDGMETACQTTRYS